MIKAGSVRKGMYLAWRGEPVLVVDKEFSHFGRGAATVRLKFKNLKGGNVVRETFKTDDPIEEISIESQAAQFLYQGDDNFIFMDPRTYEQYEISAEIIGENKNFIKEEKEYRLVFYQGRAIGINLPKKISLLVKETETAVKGNTVSGATKPAKLETGLLVKVPLFIKKGEKIIINTETGEYVSRAGD